MTRAITPDDMARARRVLMRRDPVLRAIIAKYGPCAIQTGREADIFCGLVESIVSQQLSTKAARTRSFRPPPGPLGRYRPFVRGPPARTAGGERSIAQSLRRTA